MAFLIHIQSSISPPSLSSLFPHITLSSSLSLLIIYLFLGEALWREEVLLGARQGIWRIQRGAHREHRGREGDRGYQGRGEEGVQEGPGRPGQPPEVRLLRGHVQPDLPQRRLGSVEPEDSLRERAHLHLLRALLYRGQPVQGYLKIEFTKYCIFHISLPTTSLVRIWSNFSLKPQVRSYDYIYVHKMYTFIHFSDLCFYYVHIKVVIIMELHVGSSNEN